MQRKNNKQRMKKKVFKMKHIKLILFTGFLLLAINSTISAQGREHKVIFQFTNAIDTNQEKAFVKQLENLSDYWPDASFEVVLYNQGIELVMSKNQLFLSRLNALHQKGIQFKVCENTLINRKISKDVFIPEIVEYVKAGIAEIVEKQEEGWIYIKGGF